MKGGGPAILMHETKPAVTNRGALRLNKRGWLVKAGPACLSLIGIRAQ